ncbi:hypothetical protein ACRAWD_24250 [Caulobacter segnis]
MSPALHAAVLVWLAWPTAPTLLAAGPDLSSMSVELLRPETPKPSPPRAVAARAAPRANAARQDAALSAPVAAPRADQVPPAVSASAGGRAGPGGGGRRIRQPARRAPRRGGLRGRRPIAGRARGLRGEAGPAARRDPQLRRADGSGEAGLLRRGGRGGADGRRLWRSQARRGDAGRRLFPRPQLLDQVRRGPQVQGPPG